MNDTRADSASDVNAANSTKPLLPVVEWKRSAAALVVLTLLALAGNYFALPLFFGVEFVFGSIFVLVAVHGFGAWRGGGVALVAALYTWILWHHPYAIVLFVGEAVFVGLLLRRVRNMLLLDGLYWLLIGMPLVYLIYGHLLEMDDLSVGVVMLKDALNGLFNALMASLLVKHFPALAWPGRPQHTRLLSLRQAAFNIIVGCVLLPALIITVIDCRRAKAKVESDLSHDVTQRARLLSREVNNWKQQRVTMLSQIAKLMSNTPGAPQSAPASTRSTDFQHDIALLAGTLPDALAVGLRDEKSREIASFFTDANEKISLAKAEEEIKERAPNARRSNGKASIYLTRDRRAGKEEAQLAFVAPISNAVRNAPDASRGYAVAVMSLDALQVLVNREQSADAQATIIDQSGRVLASTRADAPALSTYSLLAQRAEKGRIIAMSADTYQWFPASRNMPPMTRWQDSVLAHTAATSDLPWKIVVEAPFAAQQRRLQALYFNNLALMLALSLAALALAELISRALHRPLHELALVTHGLPSRLMSDEAYDGIAWPSSRLDQMQALIGNFKQMSETLRANFRDVASTRERLEEEQARLKEAGRLKDEFLAVVSHELRTPLVPVIGYADLLSRGLLTSEEDQLEAVRAIERNARIQLRLVEDLLDVSRIVSGQMRIESGAVNLAEIVRDSLQNMQLAAQAKEITISFDLASDVPLLLGDRNRLTQVMWNLLSNAIKFTPQNGTVQVALAREDGFAVISVRDNGQGISADFLPHMFSRFRQAAPHLTRSEGGLGLGLSIARDIVELHGGTIEAFSEGDNCGATFVVKLPLQSTALLDLSLKTLASHDDSQEPIVGVS